MIHDLIDNVAGATWLTKVDVNKGFYQVLLDKDSRDMTAFCSPWGKFTFTRMPFGVYKTAFPNNQISAQLTLTIFLSIPLLGRNIWNTSEVC